MEFRTLNANEIDCRIATIDKNGLSLLLYKDARVDQNILDETVGAMNWQRHHSRDNANCTVAIWDAEKSQWIEKEDTGTESFTEKEKGLASDSFKRACFNWGIGRELYSAPFIWINPGDANIKQGNNGKYQCYDKFVVEQILYDENKNIVALSIKNNTLSRRVFVMDTRTPNQVEPKEQQQEQTQEHSKASEPTEQEIKDIQKMKIPEIKIKVLVQRCEKEGVPTERILKLYKVSSFADITELQFRNMHDNWDKIKAMR